MPEPVFSILGALILLNGMGRRFEIIAYSGYENGSVMRYLGTMKKLGWIEKRAETWFITERGKIVFAIESGRRVKVRGAKHYRAQSSAAFDRLHAGWATA